MPVEDNDRRRQGHDPTSHDPVATRQMVKVRSVLWLGCPGLPITRAPLPFTSASHTHGTAPHAEGGALSKPAVKVGAWFAPLVRQMTACGL